ncbi:MAG: MMPL family transporter, partial [Micropruina sp.]
MSSLLYRIGRASFRHRGRVLAAWFVLLGLIGAVAGTAGGTFDDAFSIPGASSQRALDQLRMTFPEAADASAQLLVILPEGQTMDSPAVRSSLERSFEDFESLPEVNGVQSPYSEHIDGQITPDGRAGLAQIRVQGTMTTVTPATKDGLAAAAQRLQEAIPGSEVHLGGEIYSVHLPRLSWIEVMGLVVAVVVLLVVLGSFIAAMMPIATAVLGLALTVAITIAASAVVPINSTTLILAVMLALAVGIDYALFIVSRHRDQLATGLDAEESTARAVATAGSAVVFAGLTVIIGLVGLGIAGIPFLGIMGIFSAVGVAIEVLLSLTLLPALLGFAGERLRPKPRQSAGRHGPSSWWVNVLTKAPVLVTIVVIAVLGALTVPAKDLQLSLPNSGQNSREYGDRVTFDKITDTFGVGYNGALIITGTIVESDDPLAIMDGLRAEIEVLEGVKLVSVSTPNQNADTGLVQVIPTTGPADAATIALVERLRDKHDQWLQRYGIDTAVTGSTAVQIDVSSRLASALLPFGVFVVGLSLVLLTLVFRSILVPLKAAAGYLLSVGAAFGVTHLVFNLGWFKEVINLPEPVPVISFYPIMLMGVLFGLAMDYEVFLVSRMREEFVHGDGDTFIERGFEHSSKVVVAAALIMFAVFAFFVPDGEGTVKPIAFGLAIGVAIDAFLIRMTLGPAVMKLLGRRSWWLPNYLADRLPVVDVEGESLAHQLSLADWPTPGDNHLVYAEGLSARVGGRTLFADLAVALQPGEVVGVEGPADARAALLLGLTGRTQLTSGRIKAVGLVLP